MTIHKQARVFILVVALVAAIGTSALAVRFAGAQPIHQTGPSGEQCNLKGLDTDFSGPDNSDQTNDALNAIGNSFDNPPLHVAGCDLMVQPVDPPTPTPPTPTPAPTRLNIHGPLPAGVRGS
jgi:hypothetical protein